jgi:sugar lactone lactonase YvrE
MTSEQITSFSVVDPAGIQLGEHPLWDAAHGRIGWVDVFGGVLRWVCNGALDLWQFPEPLGAAGLRRSGGVIAAAGDGLHFRDAAGREDREPITGLLPEGVRFNDGACDPHGHFICGTTSLDGQRDRGSLYRISPEGDVEILESSITESNGLAWSPKGTTLYYVDSGEPAVRRYRYRSGEPLSREQDLIEVVDGHSVPDGLCIDGAGALWVALWEGSALWRVSPEGELLEALPTPTSRPTCATFGGAHLERLFVATAWEGLDQSARSEEPWAGHLLACETRVPGAGAHAFWG